MKRWSILILLSLGCVAAWAKTVVIDVRTEDEYAQEHIAGAINIDHRRIGQVIQTAAISPDDRVILYCRSGRRSAIAEETLKSLGFRQVENYGGIEAARKRLNTP